MLRNILNDEYKEIHKAEQKQREIALEKKKEENRKRMPVTASIVDDFKKLFGEVKVISTTELRK